MIPPGLLPETPPRRALPIKIILVALVLLLLVGVGIAGTQLLEVRRQRDQERVRVQELTELLRKPVPVPGEVQRRLQGLEARLIQLEGERKIEGGGAGETTRVETRGVTVAVDETGADRMLLQAEMATALAALRRADHAAAISSLAGAMKANLASFRRIKPRDLFRSMPEKYDEFLAALETRVRDNPLDADAKILLACFYMHEKGAGYARALLAEALAVQPQNGEAKQLLDGLDK